MHHRSPPAAFLLSAALLLVTACAIPPRDNGRDPANIPDPPGVDIDVFVNDVESPVGQRHARWRLDGSGSDAPAGSCYDWSMSTVAAEAAAEIPDDEWAVLVEGDTPCDTAATLVVSTALDALPANGPFRDALAAVRDFDNGTGVPDGTGITNRWVRLTIEKPNGGRATAFKMLTVVNEVPNVSLGPSRRTAPGGRWWLTGDARRFTNVITANVTDDPDPLIDLRWRVTGELATRLDLANEYGFPGAATDGYVDSGFYDETTLSISLPMSIDPSRSTITAEVRDFVDDTGTIAVRAGEATIDVDVLSTLWAYTRSNGYLRRIDTSQFLGPFTDEDSEPLAFDATTATLLWGRSNGTTIDLFRSTRGLDAPSSSNPFERTISEFATAAFTGRMAAAPRTGGGWWVVDGQEGRLYRLSSTLAVTARMEDVFTVVVGPALPDFRAGGGGNDVALAEGGSGRLWVAGGEPSLAGQRLLLVRADATAGIGNALVVPPIDPFPAATTEIGHLAPDGAGGVWVAGNVDRSLSHVTIDAANNVTVTPITLPDGCISAPNAILSMASDPARNALWLGVTTNEPDSEGLCRLDTASGPGTFSYVLQKAEQIDTIAINPADGSAYLVANLGQGLNRYAPSSGASMEYLPLHAGTPGSSGVSVQQARFMDNNLLVTVSQQAPSFNNKRALVVEAAEVHVVDTLVDLHIDPYVMDFERHVTDPVTGFVFVFLPDDGLIAVYAPDGTRVSSIEVGYLEKRAHLAFDPDSRRLWLAFSNLWVGDATPGDPGIVGDIPGRLLYVDVPENFPDGLTMTEVPGVYIAMSRGMSVVPASASVEGGRLCLAADFEEEPIPDARIRTRENDGTDTGETPVNLDSGQDIETWVSADPTTGECWAGERGFSTFFVRMLPNGTATAVSTGYDVRHADVVAPGLAFGITTTDFDELLLLDVDSSDVTVDNPAFDAAYGQTLSALRYGAVDPYWGHVWFALHDAEGNVVRMTVGLGPHEAWREQNVLQAQIDNGR